MTDPNATLPSSWGAVLSDLLQWRSQAGVGGWALALMALVAVLVMLRGLLQWVIAVSSLALAVAAGALVLDQRMRLLGSYAAEVSTTKLMLLAALAGLLVFFLTRALLRLMAKLGLLAFLAGLTGWKAGLLSLLPSSLALGLGAFVMRGWTAVASLQDALGAATAAAAPSAHSPSRWLAALSEQWDRSALGSWMESLDPFDLRARSNLARLLVLWPDGRVWRELAQRDEALARMLNDPAILELGSDAQVRLAIEKHNVAGLMQMRQVAQAAADARLEPLLKTLVLEQAMDEVIYRSPAAAAPKAQPLPAP